MLPPEIFTCIWVCLCSSANYHCLSPSLQMNKNKVEKLKLLHWLKFYWRLYFNLISKQTLTYSELEPPKKELNIFITYISYVLRKPLIKYFLLHYEWLVPSFSVKKAKNSQELIISPGLYKKKNYKNYLKQ